MIIIYCNKKIAVLLCFIFCFSYPAPQLQAQDGFKNGLILEEEVELPVLMYHFLCKEPYCKWSITPTVFENDLIYIKEKGYTPIVVKDIIDYVNAGVPLAENPIMLTFDDGDSSVFHTLLPLLEKYDMKAVVSIIGDATDKYSAQNRTDIRYYPNITWDQIREMAGTGLVDIQSHSYNLHHDNGAKKTAHESDAEYEARLSEDLIKLQNRMQEELGTKANAFAYPFGAYSSESDNILKKLGFSSSFICAEKTNYIRFGEPDTLFQLNRFLRPDGISSEVFFEKIGK